MCVCVCVGGCVGVGGRVGAGWGGGVGVGGGNFSVCGTPSRFEVVERVWVLRKTSVTVRERRDDLQKTPKKTVKTTIHHALLATRNKNGL